MLRTLTAIFIAASIILAPAGVQARAPAPSIPAAEAASRRVALATGPYRDVLLEANGIIETEIDTYSVALDFIQGRRPRSELADWLAGHRASVRDRIAALKSHQAALSPLPANDLRVLAAATPGDDGPVIHLDKTLPAVVSAIVDQVDVVADAIEPDLESAIGGDKAALRRMSLGMIVGMQAALGAENGMLDLSIASSASDSPEKPIARSIQSSNMAVSILLAAEADLFNGRPVDWKAVGAQMRALTAKSLAEARKTPMLVARSKARLAASADSAVFKVRMAKVLDSYVESGEIEEAVAQTLDDAAVKLVNGGTIDDAVDSMDKVEQLIDRRVAVDQARVSLMSK